MGVGSKSCPVCVARHDGFECWHGAGGNTARASEDTVAELLQVCKDYPEASVYEFKMEVLKQGSSLSGAVEELCWEGLLVGPNIFITQDLLHGCYKFIWDHLAKWINHTIGEKELDF